MTTRPRRERRRARATTEAMAARDRIEGEERTTSLCAENRLRRAVDLLGTTPSGSTAPTDQLPEEE